MFAHRQGPGSLSFLGLLCLLLLPWLEGPASGQTILREYWFGIPGTNVADLLNAPTYPYTPSGITYTNLFEGPVNWTNYYGTRMRGYVHPPQTGDYIFWIASNDRSELHLSSDESADNKILIASVATFTGSRVWDQLRDNNYLVQKSLPKRLEAGRLYYIEALQKEDVSGDNLAVGWQLPDGTLERPIPGSRLSPFELPTNAPSILQQPASLTLPEGETARFEVTVEGAVPLSFQWRRNGAILDAPRYPALVWPGITLADHGSRFQCVISNSQGSVTSVVAVLKIGPENVPPTVSQLNPPPNLAVPRLTQVEVTFSEPILGIEAGDLLINGVPATHVTGLLAGPYVFEFPEPLPGLVQFQWSPDHGITDESAAPNAFAGGTWTSIRDPAAEVGDLVINEFLASNQNGLVDENGQAEDWIEIYNRGTNQVNLAGWSLTDDPENPGQWVFPARPLAAHAYLVVYASGRDLKPLGTPYLHTNFKLSGDGEYLGLFSPESPRVPKSQIAHYPEQRNDFSYGLDTQAQWAYFSTPTPRAANSTNTITGIVSPVHFSVGRGYFNAPFNLLLTVPEEGARIVYTLNGTDPTEANGLTYTNALRVTKTLVVRAAAVKTNHLSSLIRTHTYLYGLANNLRALPAISLVTDPNNLTGPTGITGINGGTYVDGVWAFVKAGDYYNPIKKGVAWERPISVEFVQPSDNGGFQAACGIRVHASDYFRPRLTSSSKFSYTLYFRGDYGQGVLHYPWFTNCVVEDFNEIVLRSGSNDQDNPFVKDELVRRLAADTGEVASHGTFVHLFINGVYKGYYNPVERIEKRFCQAWQGGGPAWDVVSQGGQPIEGDRVQFSALQNLFSTRTMTVPANYLEAGRQLDLVNFIDYLVVNAYGANYDWPGNNWRAGRERVPEGKFRFFVWDAEFSFGTYGRLPDHNTFTTELTSGVEIASFYQTLKPSAEFRLLWADRIHKHFFNGGALTDASVSNRFAELRAVMSPVITSGFDNSIATTWIPQRRANLMVHFTGEGLLASSNAPVFSQHGGRVPAGFQLAMTAKAGTIYYTTNGTDPRVMFTGAAAPDALAYTAGNPVRLNVTLLVKARTLSGTNWSALAEAEFEIGRLGSPLRISEIMYNPIGGDAYEFLELQNPSAAPLDLSGISLEGVTYRFPQGATLAAGATLVLGSAMNPAAFAARYPRVAVFGTFGGNLANGGERLALLDKNGNTFYSVDYDDEKGWPKAADGAGYSLSLLDPDGNPDDPLSWRASDAIGGSPGLYEPAPAKPAPEIRLNEIMALNLSAVTNGNDSPDWVELHNASNQSMSLAGWSLSDDGNERKFVLPELASIPAGGYFVVWCDDRTNAPGFHAGFSLNQEGETLFLFDAQTNRIDAVSFGLQIANASLGRMGSDHLWQLTVPTPGATNEAAEVAPATSLALNEWMANPLAGEDDWVELYNRDANRPVALLGLYVGTSSNVVDQIRSLSFLEPGGHLLLIADRKPGVNHLDLKLPATGSLLLLLDSRGLQIDQVSNPAQTEGVSRGRLPDGGGTIVPFPGRATPGAPNYIGNFDGPFLNELMARNLAAVQDTAGRIADWIELYNPRSTDFDLTGMSLSLGRVQPGEWPFPAGTVIPGSSYLVIWCELASASFAFWPGSFLISGYRSSRVRLRSP